MPEAGFEFVTVEGKATCYPLGHDGWSSIPCLLKLNCFISGVSIEFEHPSYYAEFKTANF